MKEFLVDDRLKRMTAEVKKHLDPIREVVDDLQKLAELLAGGACVTPETWGCVLTDAGCVSRSILDVISTLSILIGKERLLECDQNECEPSP